MTKRILTSLILAGLLTVSVFAGRRSSSSAPTIAASCHECSTTDAISFTGSGYKAGITVIVDVQGPTSYSITTKVDSNGNINVYYGTVLTYDTGAYTVTASAVSGKSITPVASDHFTVN